MKSSTIFENMMKIDDPAEAKAAGEALWAITKDWEKSEHITNPYTTKYAENRKTDFDPKQARKEGKTTDEFHKEVSGN